jgi:hypothetical protein
VSVVTVPVRYGTDLGALDPTCPAKTHGTYAAYQRGCRCRHAREAHRIYMKRLREGRSAKRTVDGCGTRRMIQALWAIGHTSQVIAEASAGRFSDTHVALLATRQQVRITTRDAVRDVYRLLAGQVGNSPRTRARAAAAGYVSPMRWGADIDDPEAVPEPIGPDVGAVAEAAVVDEVAVERALDGQRVDLTDDELLAAVQIGSARSMPPWLLSERLHMNVSGVHRLLEGELPPRRAKAAARRTA